MIGVSKIGFSVIVASKAQCSNNGFGPAKSIAILDEDWMLGKRQNVLIAFVMIPPILQLFQKPFSLLLLGQPSLMTTCRVKRAPLFAH